VIRVAVSVEGVVQGVGFRPFVYGAATARGLAGWVRNRRDGLGLEVEGPEDAVRDFVAALRREPPAAAHVERIAVTRVPPAGEHGRFRILPSVSDAAARPTLPADLATCSACTEETASPEARRHRYPFTNCTRCGPRYTLIEALPYDRARTTMRRFPMCRACAAEYAEPSDRRFHAQPIACPACGPALRLLAPDGAEAARGDGALLRAARALAAGQVVAVKGLGGFQLLVDATSPAAVSRLRIRKRRPEKPLAVMFPDAEAVAAVCELTPEEALALGSPAAPIVLVRRRRDGATFRIAASVAPRNPFLGAMLPTTPLHRLLLEAAGRPLVCTSGNLAGEPLSIDEEAALERLAGVADLLLVHDRPIVRPVDDSVARMGPAGLQVLRRARGFAPLPLPLAADTPCVLALGAQLKSTVALAVGGQVVVSQHLGDLHTAAGALLLERTVADLVRFFAARPARLACDLHPDYVSTRLAERLAAGWGVPLERVQHHHAHVAACMAEHALSRPVLGLAWDGAGLGADGALWGGEALVVEGAACRRVAHLRPFRLPGGERAMREPRRAALGLAHALFAEDAAAHVPGFAPAEARVLLGMLARGVNAPVTTAMGRLFDAVAALAGVRAAAGFEGQAAMELEFAADGAEDPPPYPLPLGPGTPAVADWEPLVHALLADRARGVPARVMAARFHAALVEVAEAVAVRAGLPTVVLAGGCFQNLRLARAIHDRLRGRGFAVYLPGRYPPNDGGIALGQVLVAAWRAQEEDHVSRRSG
jgi:hydrogenase maturation protein HypF